MRQSRFRIVYAALVAIRLGIALQKSYLHPDEFFQSAEPLVGKIFSWDTIWTWEFASSTPIRSIVPIWLFEGPGLLLLRLFSGSPSTETVFHVLRVQQCLWTLVVDYLIYTITRRQTNLLLWATSYTTLTYQTHTFSNLWETILVLSSVYVTQIPELVLLLPLLAALGISTRPSFAFFMVPIAVQLIRRCFKYNSKLKRTEPNEAGFQFIAYCSVIVTLIGALLVNLDTVFYAGRWLTIYTWDEAVYTLYNNILYNTDLENLAKHGTHPRHQHLLNVIMLLGPTLLVAWRLGVPWNIYTQALLSGFVGLSVVPHQEPRFILPCFALFCAAIPHEKVQRGLSKKLWAAILLLNGLGAVFFGVLHQGGVVPASLYIARHHPGSSVTFTRCYDAPRMLLGPGVDVDHAYGDDLFTTPAAVPADLIVVPRTSRMDVLGAAHLQRYELTWSYPWHVGLDDIGRLGVRALTDHGLDVYRLRAAAT